MIREIAGPEPTLQQRFSDFMWGQTARDKRNNKRFGALMVFWMLCYAGAQGYASRRFK